VLVTSALDSPKRTIKFCYVLFDVPVQACCHKHDSLMRGVSSSVSRYKQTLPLSAITYSTLKMLTTLELQQSSILKPNIGRKSRFLPHLGGPRRNIVITFGREKLEWMMKKNKISLLVFAARCYASAAYVVMRCLSVGVSITFVDHVKTNIHRNFFTVG